MCTRQPGHRPPQPSRDDQTQTFDADWHGSTEVVACLSWGQVRVCQDDLFRSWTEFAVIKVDRVRPVTWCTKNRVCLHSWENGLRAVETPPKQSQGGNVFVCEMERGDVLPSKGFRVTQQHSEQENHILRFVCGYYIDKEKAGRTITGDVEPKEILLFL